MALTASQLDQLHRTLLEAFTQDEMRRLLRTGMGVNFDHVIPSSKPFADQVWDLAIWADQQGRAIELAACAAADKPANQSLQALRTAAQTWDPSPAPLTAEPRTRTYLWVNVPPPPPTLSSGATISSPTWSPASPPGTARPSPRMGCPAWARPPWPWPWPTIHACGRTSPTACSGPAWAPNPT